jgi:hypothetical protein
MKKILLVIPLLFSGTIQAQVCIHNTSSLKFNGNSDYVQINSDNNLELDSAVTVEAWIKPSGFGYDYWDNSIFCKHSWSTGEQGYVLRCGANGKLSFNFAGFANGAPTSWKDIYSDDSALQLNVWQHVAGSYDGYRMRLFVNGEEVADSLFVGSMVPGTDYNPTIGRLCDAGQFEGRYFKGKIDEVRVWNRALSPYEIQQRMSVHLDPAQQTGLVGYWRLNDSTGNAIADISGSGNSGNKYGPAWQLDDVPFNNAATVPAISQSGDLLISSPSSQYQWYKDFAEINGATEQMFLVTQPGSYFVRITDSIGCSAVSDTIDIIPTSAESAKDLFLAVLSNPVTDAITVRWFAPPSAIELQLFSPLGILVAGRKLNADHGQISMDVSDLSSGHYLLMLQSGSGLRTQQVMIQR